jgi:AGCS family alanine or glycine:cation symporter
VLFTFLGSIITATNILNFGDYMILGMAFPNLVGVLMLSGKVKADLNAYWAMYKGGQFQVYK